MRQRLGIHDDHTEETLNHLTPGEVDTSKMTKQQKDSVKKGQKLTVKDLYAMNWLVKGVIGSAKG